MKSGGNAACNAFLQQHGIAPRTPIKQKYESPAAQLYKEKLKARVEGRPEPTELPKPVAKPPAPSGGAGDAQGMERLAGETDQQYIARQTRLREEARARMAAKFGNGGMSGGRMQGIGSDASYNPNAGGYGSSAGDFDVNSLVTGFGSVLGSAVNTAKSLADEKTVNTLKTTGATFWGGLTSSVQQVASAIGTPEDDGLADLQRQVSSQKPHSSKYSGFGSGAPQMQNFGSNSNDRSYSGGSNGPNPSYGRTGSMGSTGSLQEATGLPGEDPNGVERLTGESDEQYVIRQTRLRDEARARMAAKFGGGGMSSAGPPVRPPSAPSSGNVSVGSSPGLRAPSSGNVSRGSTSPGLQVKKTVAPRPAPGSGNSYGAPRPKTPPKKPINSDDFFSSFGT